MKWLWTFAYPKFVFFKIDPSRAGFVPKSIFGEDYPGVLGSDCFSAYNTIAAQAKRKCLTHYERAAKELEKFFPGDQQNPVVCHSAEGHLQACQAGQA